MINIIDSIIGGLIVLTIVYLFANFIGLIFLIIVLVSLLRFIYWFLISFIPEIYDFFKSTGQGLRSLFK